MLSITRSAAEAITELQASSELPGSTGVRIFTSPKSLNGTSAGLEMEVADEPEEGDEVIEKDGARVFLAPATASALDEKLLDVRTGPEGQDLLAVVDQ
ncbi:MAG: hypothetical protein M3P44_03690 [Actinomycetota bacterium]|nr:hypothetical protein [Actinomycetota bacterium]MDP9344816.1 hypothetical protein [Actinomycetota bacterium]